MSAERVEAEATRRLILLRHGETTWNAERRWQGQTDIELSEAGHLQAKSAAAALASYAPVALWCSDLSRAATTAAYVGERTGLEPHRDPRLREAFAGDLEGRTADELFEKYATSRPDHGAHGGETADEVADRVVEALAEVGSTLAAGETAVVVSHGTAIRHGISRLLGWPVHADSALRGMSNCGWAELVADAPDTASTPWRLAAYNRVASIS